MDKTTNTLRATVQADGTAEAEAATVLIDGSDTAVTANGIAGYVPKTGDRVLVQRVGNHVEIIQFVTRTYITGQTIRTAADGPRMEISEAPNPSIPGTYYGRLAFVTDMPQVATYTPSDAGIYGFSTVLTGTNHGNYLVLSGCQLDDPANPGTLLGDYAILYLAQEYDTVSEVAKSYYSGSADAMYFSVAQGGDGFQVNNGPLIVEGGDTGKYFQVGSGAGSPFHEIAYGLATVNVATGNATGTLTMLHGFQHTPQVILATVYNRTNYFATVSNRTTYYMDLNVKEYQANPAASSTNVFVFWLAAW